MARIYIPGPRKAGWDCPNCGAYHSLTVEHDECGGYIEPDTEPCHDDDCLKRLCFRCAQGKCDCCGLTHCAACLLDFGGERLCRVCLDTVKAGYLVLRKAVR